MERGYQFCLVDPEGDYETFEGLLVLGDQKRAPSVDEILQVLGDPGNNVGASLLGLKLEDRPAFFETLLPRLHEMRTRTGRPHWIVVDEAHHLLPPSWAQASQALPRDLRGMAFITVHPDHISKEILSSIDVLVVTGASPDDTVNDFARAVGHTVEGIPSPDVGHGEALVWFARDGEPSSFAIEPPSAELQRHRRKYAEGELGPDKSFFFRGPDGRLNLRAQNLVIFLQLAEGVDDDTWLHHLRRGDLSKWIRDAIKDDDLADRVEEVEKEEPAPTADASREAIRSAVEKAYTLPA